MGWWAAQLWQTSPVLLISWVFWVIASITLHELGHAWAAIRLGDDTPIHTRHMTVNPIVHMGPMSLIAFALLGFAWGSMPINPSRLRGTHAHAIVAAAGSLGQGLMFIAMGLMFVGSGRFLFPAAVWVFSNASDELRAILP